MAVPLTIDPRYYDAVILAVDGVVTDTSCVDATAWTQLFDDYLARWPAHEANTTHRSPATITADQRDRHRVPWPGAKPDARTHHRVLVAAMRSEFP